MEEKKKSFFSENRIEIIVAILLSITALCTAWASWISSLHGGNQATNYTTSNNLAADGNERFTSATRQLNADILTWDRITELSLNSSYAEEKGDVDEVEKSDYMLEQVMNNCSPEFLEAVNWALEQDGDVSPFDKEGYIDSYYEDAQAVLAESEEKLEEGKRDNANGDRYGLVSVFYSLVLFLLGIVGTFKHLPNRVVIMIASAVLFVLVTAFMVTIPLPTDFNLFSYFRG